MTLPDLTPTGSPLPDMAPDVGALVSYLEYDPLPAIVLDPQYQILAANRAYQRQFGGRGRRTSAAGAIRFLTITTCPAIRQASTAQ